MYRQEQRRMQEMEDQQQVISRVSNYPVVKDAWSRMSEVYQRGKDGSRVIRFCGGMVETSASLAYRVSQPVIEKLPVETVNDYAVTKLASLEENYPVLVKPTDEVVDAVKTYSTAKLEDAKVYSTDKINRLAGATGVDYVLGVAEFAVDKLLPEVEEDDDDSSPQAALLEEVAPEDVVNRALVLGGKVKHRAYIHAMSKVGALQRRSEEAVSKLVHTVDLIDFARKNLSESFSYGEVKEKLISVYGEIVSEEEDEPLPPSANWERRAISSARVLTRRVRTTLEAMSKLASALPAHTRTTVTNAYHSAEALYQTLTDSDLLTTHGNDFLIQLRANLESLKARVLNVGSDLLDTAHSILEATPLASMMGLGTQRQLAGLEVPTRFSETVDDEDEDAESEVDANSEVDSETAANSEDEEDADD